MKLTWLLQSGNLICIETSLNASEAEHCFPCLIGHWYVASKEWPFNAIYSISFCDSYLLLIGLTLTNWSFPLSGYFQR